MISRQDRLIKNVATFEELSEKILPYRDRERVMDEWLRVRYKEVLPMIMKRSGRPCNQDADTLCHVYCQTYYNPCNDS